MPTERKILRPAHWEWAAKFNIPGGMRVGDTIYVSGMIGLEPDGSLVAPGSDVDSMYAQTAKAFQNIDEVLQDEGSSLADVVRITAFLTDLDLYEGYKNARTEAFPNGVPASTAIGTADLLFNGLVEIEAVAVL